MENSFNKKKSKISLKGYYDGLPNPVTPQRQLIIDIMQKCNVVESTAFNWVKGRSKPDNPNHIRILSELTNIPEQDLWTD